MSEREYKNEIDLRRFWREVKFRRKAAIVIMSVVFGIALCYAIYREPEFTAHSSLLIEDSDSEAQGRGGSVLQMMRIFNTGGFTSSSVDNELLLVNTLDVTLATVRDAGLNVTCRLEKCFGKETLYNPPISLILDAGVADTLSRGFNVRVALNDDNSAVDIDAWRGRLFSKTLAKVRSAKLPCRVNTIYGSFTVVQSGRLPAGGASYLYSVNGYFPVAMDIYDDILCEVSDKMADGISFEYTGASRERSRAVLASMMRCYNEKRLARKRETATTELNFLTDRINSLYGELVESEKEVEKFKNERQFVNIEAEAPILLETAVDAHKDLLLVESQMMYYRQVLELLQDRNEGMLPEIPMPGDKGNSTSGSNNSLVNNYNTQVGLLMELRRSAKPGNQALSRSEDRVKELRASIITTFSQTLTALQQIVDAHAGVVGTMDSHLRSLPSVEREYINLSRDQLLKNELYAFLVEKRENALMKINSSQTLGYIIDPAYVEIKPSLKKKMIIVIAGLLAGLLASVCYVLLMLRRRQTVDNGCDLAKSGMEECCVEIDSDESAGDARTKLMTTLERGVVFIGGFGKWSDIARSLEESLACAGAKVVSLPLPDHQDYYLSDEMSSKFSLECEHNRYVFAPLTNARRFSDFSVLINGSGSVAVVIVERGKVHKDELLTSVRGITSDHLVIIIGDNKRDEYHE